MDILNCDERVSFLIAGAQKCGTTALDAYLRLHPQIEMAATKETHFFDDEIDVNWRDPDYNKLHAHFSDRPGLVRGEATPITLYWTPAHYRILRYNPDVRFIFMLRHPTERAWSHWRMNISRDLDRMPFEWAIRDGRNRVLKDGEHSGLARHSSYVERGFFGKQIASLATLFPLERMLFLRQSDLLTSPSTLLQRVSDFLGVDDFPPTQAIQANVGATPDGVALTPEDRTYLDDLFRDDLDLLQRLTGVDLDERDEGLARP